jgi:hypothetical protein
MKMLLTGESFRAGSKNKSRAGVLQAHFLGCRRKNGPVCLKKD